MTTQHHLWKILGDNPRLLRQQGNIRVYLWEDEECKGMGVLCTLGMSQRVQPLDKKDHCPSKEPRTELLSYCHLSDANILGELLLDLTEYPFKNQRHLFWWQNLPLGRQLSPGSVLDGLLLSMPPYSADEVTFNNSDGRIDLVWVVPISSSELAYCRLNGIEAFEILLEKTGVDIADVNRAAIV
ncbi:MAG TPA: hypothetical protein DET40_23060 [Lentisphaeria bacterium]|nr:MAG: hypothetical protein A2X45_15725 [Lentisphaerae bacterium GWF2_50_93]HCE46434.1 hypothetical protein [Lentisphaeria bacterium]